MQLSVGLIATAVASVSAIAPASPFSCSNVQVNGLKEWTVESKIPLRFNPCAPITYRNEACPKGTFMCGMDPASPTVGRANIGIPMELYRNPKNELVMLFSRGDYDRNGFPFVGLVRFECDRDSMETGPDEPVTDGSKYFLVWRTRAACPVSGAGIVMGSTTLSIFVWVAVGLILYFVVGMVYNILVNGKNGMDTIPHRGFWSDLVDFFRELFSNIRTRLGGHQGGYQQI